MTLKTITLDSVEYVRADSIAETGPAQDLDGMPYVVIRTYSAGVHVGYLAKKEGEFVKLVRARRVYSWEGAATLSQMAMEGVSKPESCKFPCEVDSIDLKWIEILPCREKARKSLQGVSIWSE